MSSTSFRKWWTWRWSAVACHLVISLDRLISVGIGVGNGFGAVVVDVAVVAVVLGRDDVGFYGSPMIEKFLDWI